MDILKGNADPYENLLKKEIFIGINNHHIKGYNEVEFITIMWFDSYEAVKDFARDDYEQAVVPPAARALLLRFDEISQHYEVKHNSKNVNN
jgi:hypothetical protein